MPENTLQRKLACSAACLFGVGLFTGLFTAAVLTKVVVLRMPHLALAAHLNALLGALWMLAVAFTFPFLHYSEKQLCRLSLLVGVPSWANWFVTLVASFLGVDGLQYLGQMKNDSIALALQVSVVLPALVGSVYWVRGFCKGKSA